MANWMARAQEVLDPANSSHEGGDGENDRRFCWILYRQGRPPLEVRFLPEATRKEVETRYPGSRAECIDNVPTPKETP